jgi:DNA-binding NarL/FixJ family response regulator
MHDESIYAERALRAGARGYIMKGGSLKDVMAAIRRVLEGEVFLSHAMTNRIMHRMIGGADPCAGSAVELLTERELRILELIGEGMGPSQMAKHLHLSVKTIETHRTRIREKLSLENAAALRRFAIQWIRERGM